MTDAVLDKINNIEKILLEINSKLDNYMGMEELSREEWEEVEEIREQIKKGDYTVSDNINW
ncbi:hypothetical protein AKJ43_03855 [candidate division MSBL1 archaeon SCGC-AAA261D19]|uniref:Uncharacterized protein n=1 Tax=candidate division MSBL1 archaeon SCGC-AAA261D19 TaxID=1698273 RepID=A0A133V3B3_9EURY|nr:hypothetical protein AKJ43_03855 [candidate division MSBL1 archaeon SCGC-AAA261D19]